MVVEVPVSPLTTSLGRSSFIHPTVEISGEGKRGSKDGISDWGMVLVFQVLKGGNDAVIEEAGGVEGRRTFSLIRL